MGDEELSQDETAAWLHMIMVAEFAVTLAEIRALPVTYNCPEEER